MKENYRAWRINPEDFYHQVSDYDKMKFLIRFAALAPSANNDQPWRFKIFPPNIFLTADPLRSNNQRPLFISLGCALENLLIAADYYGYNCAIEYGPATSSPPIIKISLKQVGGSRSQGHLIFAISSRHTNRNPYLHLKLPESFLKKLFNFSDAERKVDIIEDETKKNALAHLVNGATEAVMADRNFRLDLSKFVKPNFTHSKVGIPGFALGMNGLVSLLVPLVVKYLNIAKLNKKKNEILLKKFTPFFVLISTKNDDHISWLKAGQLYERIALEAAANDIKTAPLFAPIQAEEFCGELRRLFNISFKPQFLFRMGYADVNSLHTPRLSVEEVIQK